MLLSGKMDNSMLIIPFPSPFVIPLKKYQKRVIKQKRVCAMSVEIKLNQYCELCNTHFDSKTKCESCKFKRNFA